VKKRELRALLQETSAPGESEASARTWQIVRSAYDAREPVRRPRRRLVVALAAAALVAVAVAVASPPGRAVLDSIREAIGEEHAAPALFSLPAPGRVLAAGPGGAWVVSDDGSKRRLGDYGDAGWSPFGRFVAVAGSNELAALEPDGDVRWTLARPGVRFPRWGGTETDTRIAYLTRSRLHVVAGDGTGDADLGLPRAAPVAPVWQPAALGRELLLAYADTAGRIHAYAPGSRTVRFTTAPEPVPSKLEWSSDGTRLLAVSPAGLRVYDLAGRRVDGGRIAGGRMVDAAFLPGTHDAAVVLARGEGSDVLLLRSGRVIYRATGALSQVVPSPDGRWLLLGWPAADEWVFLRLGGRRIAAVANIAGQLGGAFPAVGGWARPSDS
jgi:hypothetical protein